MVVVVIGDLPSTFSTPSAIPDQQLLPYDEAVKEGYNYYVATGGQSINASHTLGTGERITLDSTEYHNNPLSSDQKYSYFVRAYSKHVRNWYYCMTQYLTWENSNLGFDR